MGGRAGQRADTTQTTQLPQDQQQNVDMLLSGARDFYQTGGPKYYQGNTVAPTDVNTTAGRNLATGYAGGAGSALANDAVSNDRFWLNPNNVYDPTRIPGYARAREAVQTDATNNLTRNVLPAIRSSAVTNGAYGGSRQGIAEGLAGAETARNVGDTLARMDMDAYGQGLGQANAAAARAPTTYGLGLAPSQTLQQVGQLNQQTGQQQIDADMARWNFQQLAPLLNLQNFQGLTGTAGQYGGTTTGQQRGNLSGGGNNIMPLLGGVLSLASLFGGGS